ncbi:beta strand repeat-containing protein [Nostoc sp.]|uniref:beta strand repeat-containing protein n=1 Tax=Nostoc sp. TaxID=1180 RepID=UPI002FF53CDB
MKSLFKNLKSINKPAWKSIPGISLSVCTSLLTISTSVGIGITFNPERSWAGSACAGVYSSRSGVPTSTQSQIGYYNSITKSYVSVATYNGGNINAIATQPSTGNLFFVNRATGNIVVYNPNTGSQTTLTGTLPGDTTTIIGATFNASGKLYVYYSNRTLIEVNPSTGSQTGSTISISGIPGNNDASPRVTNGDIAIGTDGVLYAVGDTSSSGGSYTSQLYSITISGTTGTATPVNGNNLITGVSGAAVNGLAIDPSTNKFYVSTSNGTYELDFTTKAATLLTSATGTNDLAACGSPPPDLPTISKSFSPDTVTTIPANSTLTLTLGNTNLVPIYLIQALTDNFQSGLTVSTPNGLSGTCTTISGNTVTATAGSALISLNDGFKIPAGGCTVSVNVTANSAGTYTNSIAAGALKTFVGNNANAATSTLSVTPKVSISGTVFDDADGSKIQNGTETGNNGGGLNAVLVNSSNQVVATTAVATNGTYTFSNVPSNANYTVQITTATATVGSTPPAVSLPTNWVSTGENLNGTIDGTVDSKVSVSVTTNNVTGVNFGIEQVPDTTTLSPASQTNPGGTAKVQVPTLAGTDPEDGALGSGNTFKIVTLPTNGTLTYNGTAVTAGQIISNYNPTLLQLDPNDGTITVSFTYAAVDRAGQVDPTPATVSMPFTAAPVTISGTVFDDIDGSKLINGTETGTNAGGINAVLVDSTNKVVATSTVAANGTYTFSNVPANANYTVQITTATATVGAAPPAIALPSGWVSTGENLNGVVDGTVDSKVSVSVTTSNVTGVNFGIEQVPDTTTLSPASQTNPGGTAKVQVPTLAGTDPEDGALGSGNTFKIVTLPTNGTLTYNGTAVTAGQIISNYNPTLLQLDPNDGTITVSFTYAAVDRAGQVDPTPATVSIPFTAGTALATIPNVLLVKRITAINGGTTTLGGDSLVSYIDSPTNPYDDNDITIPTQPTPTDPPQDTDKWPSLNSFMLGGINGGYVKPGEEIEYTIYFLSAGKATANNVLICDRIPDNATFIPTAFNNFAPKNTSGLSSGDRGIIWQNNGVTESLTNTKDGDTAEYLSPGVNPTTNYPSIKCDGSNTNGVVVVNLGNVPNATAPGTPINSYGFIRFRVKVK